LTSKIIPIADATMPF